MGKVIDQLTTLGRARKRAVIIAFDAVGLLIALWLAFCIRYGEFYTPVNQWVAPLAVAAVAHLDPDAPLPSSNVSIPLSLAAFQDYLEQSELFCRLDYRGSIAASFLKREGYQQLANVLGGMTAWKNSKLRFVGSNHSSVST